MITTPRRRRSGLLIAALATALAVSGTAALAEPTPGTPELPVPAAVPGRYIVTLAAEPLAVYDGGVAGIPATKPADGRRIDLSSSAARRYRAYLRQQQDRAAARVGARPQKRYVVGVAAFTAELTGQQARTLAKSPGVLGVSKDTMRKLTDDRNSVDYLRLSGRNGVWADLGGTGRAGRGVVVGVVDSGIWPESASFAGADLGDEPSGRFVPYRSGRQIVMTKSDGGEFRGGCEAGEDFTGEECNTKLVGARAFGEGWKSAVPPERRNDYDSPRDGDGHGTHTASTAAGNTGVQAVIGGRDFGKVSGVAPAAKIAAYKACWQGIDAATTGCFTSDLLAALDAAITDNVDVINFSIGSSSESELVDPTEIAFLSAASSGIFVAASAGNNGPGPSTTDHPSPWITTVAASTIAPYYGMVRLGNGEKYAGISTTVTEPVGPAPLIQAASAVATGQTAANAALCAPNSLDPAKVTGTIVVCDRGVVARVAKSAEVERAGGIGMVLANLTASSLDADTHALPTVHLNPPGSTAVKAYAGTAGAQGTLLPGNDTSFTIPYPQIAGFSSRGPSQANRGDLIKPDLAAPGVSILAAVAPPANEGRDFDFLSGTSMASPHVAGLAALFYGAGVHPRWSPMRVKSALMTTARNTKTGDGGTNTDPFAQGAGEVRPSRMFDPGLVYNSTPRQWIAYLEGQGYDTGTGIAAIDPSDFNSPSIAVGSLLRSQTVTRRVTAVKPGLYYATASIPGMNVRVFPSVLNFRSAGETKTFRVSFTNRSAPFDEAATGFLTWRGAGTRVRIPMAVTPKVVDAPEQVSGSGASGSIRYTITPGISGPFPITASGLASGEAQSRDLPAGQQAQFPATIAADTKVAQFSVRTPNPAADLDLYVFQIVGGSAVEVGRSATGAADETVTLPSPAAGNYVAVVDVYANAPGTSSTPFTFRAASVQAGPGLGGFSVSPANPTARVGVPITLTASWSGLEAGVPYLGFVEYPDGSGTIVTVN